MSPGRGDAGTGVGAAITSNQAGGAGEVGGQEGEDLVDGLDEVDGLLHPASAGQGLQGRPHRHRLGPVLAPDEHQWRQRRIVARVVERCHGLEDLLHRAGRAVEHDDTGRGPGEQTLLADGVGEVLRDDVAEDVGRLVPVEPRRDAEGAGRRPERLRGTLRLVAHDGRAGGQRDRRPRRHVRSEARHGGDPSDGLLDRLGRAAQRTEVGGLHRTRPTAGRDEVTSLGQRVAETGRSGIGRRVSLQRMPAHDPHDRAARDELVELIRDGVVVDRTDERAVGIGAQLRVDEPRVGARVGRRGIPLLEAGVEIGGEVEAAPRVDGRVGDAGEDDGTAVQEDLGDRGRHGATEHDEAGEVTVGGEVLGVAREVEVLQPQSGQRPAGVEVVVQLGEGLDLHAPILRHRPARRRTAPHRRPLDSGHVIEERTRPPECGAC